jgi:hypothetical protein
MKHKSTTALHSVLSMAKQHINLEGRYAHYKHPTRPYRVVGLGFLESTDELCVIYTPLDSPEVIFLRPFTSWQEMVFYRGKTVARFSLLPDDVQYAR